MRRSVKWEGAIFMLLGAATAAVGLWAGSLLIALLGLIPLGGGSLLLFDHPVATYHLKEKVAFPQEDRRRSYSDEGDAANAPPGYRWDGTYAYIYDHVSVRSRSLAAVPRGAALTLEAGQGVASILYRGEPVAELQDSAFLTMINTCGGPVDVAAAEGARELTAISLRFSHPASASVKIVKLSNTSSPEIQRTLSRCQAGLPVTLRIDFEKQRYRASCDGPIGYLPRSAESFVEGGKEFDAVLHALSSTPSGQLAAEIAVRLHERAPSGYA